MDFYNRETQLLFHEVIITTDILNKEENVAFERLLKIIDTALLISDRVKFCANYGDGLELLEHNNKAKLF